MLILDIVKDLMRYRKGAQVSCARFAFWHLDCRQPAHLVKLDGKKNSVSTAKVEAGSGDLFFESLRSTT